MSNEIIITGGVSMSPSYTTPVTISETVPIGTTVRSQMYQMKTEEGVTLYEGRQLSQRVSSDSKPRKGILGEIWERIKEETKRIWEGIKEFIERFRWRRPCEEELPIPPIPPIPIPRMWR